MLEHKAWFVRSCHFLELKYRSFVSLAGVVRWRTVLLCIRRRMGRLFATLICLYARDSSKFPLENSSAHISRRVPPSDVRSLDTDGTTRTATRLRLFTCAASYVEPYKVMSDSSQIRKKSHTAVCSGVCRPLGGVTEHQTGRCGGVGKEDGERKQTEGTR